MISWEMDTPQAPVLTSTIGMYVTLQETIDRLGVGRARLQRSVIGVLKPEDVVNEVPLVTRTGRKTSDFLHGQMR